MATPEFFGVGGTSVPSIYWAIIDPSPDLCTPSLLDWGMVASEQGLALAFPAMAAREECGALLAYVYGGNTTLLLDGNSYPAYAGEVPRSVLSLQLLMNKRTPHACLSCFRLCQSSALALNTVRHKQP